MNDFHDAHSSRSTSVASIRSRPAMYVGPLDSPNAISLMLQEAMCIALDACIHGCASELRITRSSDHILTVWHNASKIDPTLKRQSQPVIEMLLTTAFACRDFKTTGNDLCKVGLVATNALSEWLTIEFTHDHQVWQQQFLKGVPQSDIRPIGRAETEWCQISLLPDRTIFPDIQLNFPTFQDWLRETISNAPGCQVTLRDELSDADEIEQSVRTFR